jgi:hypothetical protein
MKNAFIPQLQTLATRLKARLVPSGETGFISGA